MKKILFLFATILSTLHFTQAQNNMNQPPIKKIEVTGTAEEEVLPDKIYVSITLKEYFKEKDNKNRVDILVLEQQLQKAVADAGVPKESLVVGGINGYREWWGRKKPTNFLENKTYTLLLPNLSKIDAILNRVDEKGILSTNIERFEYSKIDALKKEVKIKALQAAKEKASYLLAGIGEQLGEALEIYEIDNGYYPQPVYAAAMMKREAVAMDNNAPMVESTVDVQKIKVRFEMKAVFKIK
ncbi:SIMPL domain-containing protein [Flectobacillus major]|jgi:uncharacterized protein YggE|uniref:SIMPL domain-containing protein n=1 Tax=Flectobacillus major TaxID=103 RepID=UPI0005C721FE|nr:SIMPL domain-containing protein [Flectobacillus major]